MRGSLIKNIYSNNHLRIINVLLTLCFAVQNLKAMKTFTLRFFIILFAACVVNTKAFTQYPKLIVQFTDKKNSPYRLDKPAQYLSQKAIQRRKRYDIAIDSTDLPVN